MTHPYPEIIKELSVAGVITVEPFRGQKGMYGAAFSTSSKYIFIPRKDWWDDFTKELFSSKAKFICFDMRRIMDFPINSCQVIDVKTLCGGGEGSLLSRMREHFPSSALTARLNDVEQRAAANMRALKTSQVELKGNLNETMSAEFFDSWLKARSIAISQLYYKFEGTDVEDSFITRYDFIKSLHEVELNGIRIDKDFVDAQLMKVQETAVGKCLRSMQSLYNGGFVTSLFNSAGTKTGRLRPEGGFGAMGIPHGQARKAIISRFEEGKIYSFDYNAIDYRSIVSSIGGTFASLYRESKDFHRRTAQFIFSEVDDVRREAFKAISYTSIYGGSEETLAQRTGLSKEMVKTVLDKLNPHIKPIHEFRDKLWGLWQVNGYIDIPGVGRYNKTEEDMHPGKLLALYAQGYSAYVFERAFTEVHSFLKAHGRGTCIIFPVHDELVVDMHPDDISAGMENSIRVIMEKGITEDFVVNSKKGRSYGEVE